MIDISTRSITPLLTGAQPLLRAWKSGSSSILVAGAATGSAEIAALQREYALRASLRDDWAAVPLGLVTDGQGTRLILSDPGGEPLSVGPGRTESIESFLAHAIALANTVRAMHAAGLVHRALAPARCLIANDGSARLHGFGWARHAGETLAATFEEFDCSSLPYMAPELGARMNVGVDQRADLYSIGCVFYEMLTGAPPFGTVDPAALAHAHASNLPRHVDEFRRDVPRQVSLVVMRLLEKAPEARYTNASGLTADLRRCDELLRRHGHVPSFPLDIHTELQRLQQADCVLGREDEIAAVMGRCHALPHEGAPQTLWIVGPAGIGKTTLLTAIERRIHSSGAPLIAFSVRSEGRNATRYALVIQLIEQLLHYVIGCPDEEFLFWRERIEVAVADDDAPLRLLLPTLSFVLRPSARDATPHPIKDDELIVAAMARLLACFATRSRRLVLLIDDLQWADLSTLRVIERLLTCRGESALLVVGAFRGNEIGADHPLRTGALVTSLTSTVIDLGPLPDIALLELVSRALGQDSKLLVPLSKEIGRDTGGNPFFVHQRLRLLADDGLLEYDVEAAAWHWSLTPLSERRAEISGGDHSEARLAKLPPLSCDLLRVLACLGLRSRTEIVAAAAGVADCVVTCGLQPALEAGCVAREGDDWILLHERARETAYASIPIAERARLHRQIARRLMNESAYAANVFDLAGQVKRARAAVEARDERVAFGCICLEAGRRAMAATACHSALAYLHAALDYFGEDDWSEDALNARKLCCEAEIMTGASEAAESRLSSLAVQMSNGVLGAEVARLRVDLYTQLERFERALEVGVEFLNRTGIVIPTDPRDDEVEAEWHRFASWLNLHGIEGLHALAGVVDPLQRALAALLSDLIVPAQLAEPKLADLLMLRAANIATGTGLSDTVVSALLGVSRNAVERFGNPVAAKAIAQASLDMLSNRGPGSFVSRAYLMSGIFAAPWISSTRSGRREARQVFDVALGSEDQLLAGYCATHQIGAMLFAGDSLGDVLGALTRGFSLLRNRPSSLWGDALYAQQMLVKRLRGVAVDGARSQIPDSERFLARGLVFGYWVYQLQAALLFDDIPEAQRLLVRAEQHGRAVAGFPQTGEVSFYGALTLLALPERNARDEVALTRYVDQLARYERAFPFSYDARCALVRAEVSCVRGADADASAGYAKALKLARSHNFAQVEALACELAGRFHARRGEIVPSQAYLRQAYIAWQRWGATARADWIMARHPELSVFDAVAPMPRRLHHPDVQAVLRISDTLASNIVPERLVETLLQTALESTGAARGALLSCYDGVWVVQARAQVQNGAIEILPDAVALSTEILPFSLIQAVVRKQEGVLIDDLRDEPAFAHDEYVRRQRPRSVLCVPLMRYATLVGALYLENNFSHKVFTPAKAALMEVLASQTAFALENARLYESLKEENRHRAQAEEKLRATLTEISRASRLNSMGELVASVVHELSQPVAAINVSVSAALRWLNRDTPQLDEASNMLRHISLSATRATAIIQAVRAKAKRSEPQFARVDLSDALHEVVTLIAASLESLQVRLYSHGSADPIYVRGDRVQLQQVVINLLMNGGESMSNSADPRRLDLFWGTEADGKIRVVVDDEGCGIPPEVADHMLEPLFTTKESGMGMGLAICNSIINAHGGALTLKPRETKGTSAIFTLPAWFV
jgi:predicted ATPase/signal transduction histidine kinase